MPGMYPDDQLVEIFGERVMYPGLHPETHKFTDGDFSDPLIKPSHIPASTFNLILDNMENLIKTFGLAPNNTDKEQLKNALLEGFAPRVIGEYHYLSRELSIKELIKKRYLPLKGQIIEISLYKELCDLKWVGASANATADWWYKCDLEDNRDPNGLYMKVEDPQGLFPRFAGVNSKYKGANNTPYDGKLAGSFVKDAIRNITGGVAGVGDRTSFNYADGAFILNPRTYRPGETSALTANFADGFYFNASLIVPTSYENCPASLSMLAYMSY